MDSLEYLLEHISEEDHLQDTVVDGRKKIDMSCITWTRTKKWWALVHVAVGLLFS